MTLIVRSVENTVNKNKGNQRMKKKKGSKGGDDNFVDVTEAKFLFSLSMAGGINSAVQAAIKTAQSKATVPAPTCRRGSSVPSTASK
jgi:ribosomal protein L16/L10AE